MSSDFWRVNSYSYPNPFSAHNNARQAWEILLTFYEHKSYDELKAYWESGKGSRLISSHGVESWKATFEEFGLLYVLSRSGEIAVTPAGYEFRDAGLEGDVTKFAWIGLSLLFRYRLRGIRRAKSPCHAESDLLLYWFFYAALRELSNYLWRSEIDRVLCHVFKVDEAQGAIDTIRRLRSGDLAVDDLPSVPDSTRGGFYNSINQVLVHAGLYYLLLAKDNQESPYGEGTEQRIELDKDWLSLVDLALGQGAEIPPCEGSSRFISRMPRAPQIEDEQGYFDYLGAKVGSIPTNSDRPKIPYAAISGGAVAILSEGLHYRITAPGRIAGNILQLCALAVKQRIILSHDLQWSYIILDKERFGSDEVVVRLQRGRPITNSTPILELLR